MLCFKHRSNAFSKGSIATCAECFVLTCSGCTQKECWHGSAQTTMQCLTCFAIVQANYFNITRRTRLHKIIS
uniref:Uncharacterized protein n=1 Tax=Rhipicephalus pulchellus TaxID=72859 RepID=L7M0H1_RHIPC